ncbi:MAG: hypothetical protein LBS23_03070 [Holosporaceae bacterium]|jgi:hypothetical protein|nr:hypothetical protein [Holosporaceae bacterium]
MKIDFKNINEKHITANQVFYLYGNYKGAFGTFCDFIKEELRKKSLSLEMHFCSLNECSDIINGQCDLFEKKINCLCIRNLEDKHLEKLSAFLNSENNVFILESGDYGKSKKITDYFLQDKETIAIASFKNDVTLYSLSKLILPNLPQSLYDKIIKIINETDEELLSIFKKISLLLEDDSNDLKEYVAHKKHFLSQLEFIPLIRYLLQSIIKTIIMDKNSNSPKTNSSNAKTLSFLLNAEIRQKLGCKIDKSRIYYETIAYRNNFVN